MGMYIKLYKKIITSVKIISKLIFKSQFHQKRAHDIWRAVRSQFPGDLVTFTEKILNEKLHFLCNVNDKNLRGAFRTLSNI